MENNTSRKPPPIWRGEFGKNLEEFGIGRPSTYATIITTLQDRGYAILEKNDLFQLMLEDW